MVDGAGQLADACLFAWLQEMLGLSGEEKARIEKPLADSPRLAQPVFSRWP